MHHASTTFSASRRGRTIASSAISTPTTRTRTPVPSIPRQEHEPPALELSGRGSGLVLLLAGTGTLYYRDIRPRRAEGSRAWAETERQTRHGAHRDGVGAGGEKAEFC